MYKFYSHLRVCYSHTLNLCKNMPEFRLIALKELTACRYIVEKVTYSETAAHRTYAGFLLLYLRCFY